VRAGSSAAPLVSAIESVTPNPSFGSATIAFTLARGGPTTLAVVDVAGRVVVRLMDGDQPAGRYEVAWDASAAGRRLRAGVYFVRLGSAGFAAVRRIVLAE
jgi:hypothetical protein